MLPNLNPLLHNQLRLSIVSLLIGLEKADFNFLLKETGASKGNLSVQINKLREAEYLTVSKSFVNNYPKTECALSPKGIKAFEEYVAGIKKYIDPNP
ncbi:MAG: transcriptional regulator [Bacteroidetes bacterium]|nr:MAG: transcriptional regulator [Bacteroidota bacterium]